MRYGAEAGVSGSTYRDVAEIRWLLFWPGADDAAGGRWRSAASRRWRVGRDGTCTRTARSRRRAVYGIPDVWPHVGAALERAGFAAGDRVEAVLVADVADLPHVAARPPWRG